MEHKTIGSTEQHIIHRWKVTSVTELDLLSPIADDLNKIAYCETPSALYILSSVSPVKWDILGVNNHTTLSGVGTRTHTQLEADIALKADKTQVLTDVPAGAVFTDTLYTHPSTDGSLHVPATSTTNSGKILTAGATAGSISWQNAPVSLPTQTGNTGKILSTDGTSASWIAAPTNTMKYLEGTQFPVANTLNIGSFFSHTNGLYVCVNSTNPHWQQIGL